MATTAPTPTISPDGGLLEVLRGLPGGNALAFSGWSAEAIAVVLAVAIEVLAGTPGASRYDVDRLFHVVWQRARGLPCGPGGAPVDLTLSRDPRAAGATLQIRDLLTVLLAAGDLSANLHAQRRRIDGLLETLAAIRAPRPPR